MNINTFDDKDDLDGCICDIKITNEEVTPDEELPVAWGGVEAAENGDPHDDRDEADCGCGAPVGDMTLDEDLPITSGGIATE